MDSRPRISQIYVLSHLDITGRVSQLNASNHLPLYFERRYLCVNWEASVCLRLITFLDTFTLEFVVFLIFITGGWIRVVDKNTHFSLVFRLVICLCEAASE